MRILMLNPFFSPYQGGTEKHVLEVGKRLSKNHDVTVLTAKLPNTPKKEDLHGMHLVRSNAWVLEDLPQPLVPPIPIMPDHAKDLAKLLPHMDLVHAHNRFFYGLDLVAASKKYGVPLYLTLHNARTTGIDVATDFWGQAFDDTIGSTVMNACTGILGVSQNTLDITLPKKFHGKKAVAYNGVDAHVFKPRKQTPNAPHEKPFVLCVARLVKQKGLKYLIDASLEINADTVIIGRGPLEKTLKKYAKKKKAPVTFITDELSEDVIAQYYAACDVFVLPSLWEPFGMVLLEAMASGKPVVSTTTGGIPEVVDQNQNGFLVPPKNPKLLAQKTNELLADPKTSKKFGRNGRKKVLKQFNWDNTTKAYEKIYLP
ncbi:glycosyltransferase family 4 protein [Candidatus Micrarchaeota archaeon]|nr:glycosyltransferase family 4 protein [Candidatus Micrarchaeota archaeon]